MQIQDVFGAYKNDLLELEKYLDKNINSEVKLIPEIAHYLIDSGGKRFRPLLLFISSSLCGYRGDHRYTMASVLEFIHTASLLHDDIVDQATIRRGKTSANNVWGNAASVLVGDYLYSKSFRLLTEIGKFPILELISQITNVMSEGEVFQLMKCGDVNITEQEYLIIIEKKTAVLLSAACAAGAILGSASQKKIDALSQFGYMVGMAFQITDDTLDYLAQEQEFGKAIGKDLEEGKMTLPLIHALKNAAPPEREAIKDLLKSKTGKEKTTQPILQLIQKYGGIEYSLQSAAKFIADAQAQLQIFDDGTEKNQLNAVAQYVLARRI